MILSPCNKCLVKASCRKHASCNMLQKYKNIVNILSILFLISMITTPLIMGIIESLFQGTITDKQFHIITITHSIFSMCMCIWFNRIEVRVERKERLDYGNEN
jgi:ABC-type spermidine/putrescine transport system permease subunit II